MGVQGLWKLLEPSGRTVELDSLEGKTLAIDASIWLTSFVKAMRDEDGVMVKNAHLIGTLRRCLRLLALRIKPVFVFDGKAVPLKIRTVQKRKAIQELHEGHFRKAAEKILLNQMKNKLLQPVPVDIVPSFHNMQSSAGCCHGPTLGMRVRVRTFAGTSVLGRIAECVSDSVLRIAMPSGEESEHVYPHEDITLVDPCPKCFPTNDEGVSAPRSSQSQPHKAAKKHDKRGRLYDSESSEEIDVSSEDDDDDYEFFSDCEEIDMSTLAELPVHMRKEVIESSRRKERARKRAKYLQPEVVSDPTAYSSTQILNFLSSSKFNRRIETLHKKPSKESDNDLLQRRQQVVRDPFIDTREQDELRHSELLTEDVRSVRSMRETARPQSPFRELGESKTVPDQVVVSSRLANTQGVSSLAVADEDVQWESGSDIDDSAYQRSVVQDDDIVQRAVDVANHMAGWAADAVKKALNSRPSTKPVGGPPQHQGFRVYGAVAKDECGMVEGEQNVAWHPADEPKSDVVVNVVDPFALSKQEGFAKDQTESAAASLISLSGMSTSSAMEDTATASLRAKSARDMDSFTLSMKQEVIDLLEVLSIPYVLAPAEAEAQCCALEELGVVDGVVTNDSDSFLFGGKTVYRNMFENRRVVEVYRAGDIQRDLGLQRNDLVAMAFLLSSDYCEGVKGIGIVNALEIIEAFPCSADPIYGLQKFADWVKGFSLGKEAKPNSDIPNDSLLFERKHRHERSKWAVPKSFPEMAVAKAYLKPEVDDEFTSFDWPVADSERLERYCIDTLGYTSQDYKSKVLPVIAAHTGRRGSQATLDNYLSKSTNERVADIRSSRLKSAVQSLTAKSAKQLQQS